MSGLAHQYLFAFIVFVCTFVPGLDSTKSPQIDRWKRKGDEKDGDVEMV